MLRLVVPHEACFGAKEGVENELDAIDDGEDPVDPPVARVVCYEAEDEGGKRYTQSDHDSPYAHELCSLFAEKGFDYDSAADGVGWTNEERLECAACCHCSVGLAFGTANVED